MSAQRTPLHVAGRDLLVSKLDKPLWTDPPFPKRDLLGYYLEVAPALLPHIRRKAMTLVRFPDGIDGPGWYQMNCRGNPSWIEIAPVHSRAGEPLRYCILDEPAALAWAANQGTIELHPFLCDVSTPSKPDVLIFDLDPGRPAGLRECSQVALLLRDLLAASGLRAFPKTSGRRGLHLYVPLNGTAGWADTEAFAHTVAQTLAAERPELVVEQMGAAQRTGRVLIDWRQNQELRSTIAPYSMRAMRTPGVSAPLLWQEVESLAPPSPSPRELLQRLQAHGDLFAEVLTLRQALPEPA